MMTDLFTMLWKEWREMLTARGGLRSGTGWWNVLLSLGIYGVFLPVQFKEMWFTSIWTVFWVVFIASFWTTSFITDSFAGERERHTLETLLASRLSDSVILFGKLGAVVGYVWGQIMLSLLLGAITVNVVAWSGQIAFYRPSVALGAFSLGLLGPGLVGGLGILISLHAPTARQSAQRLLIPVTLLTLVPSLLTMFLPQDLQAQFFTFLMEADVTNVMLTIIAVLALVNAGLIAWALSRFQRARLILD
jgi:ABC-2 type transport system permease protein